MTIAPGYGRTIRAAGPPDLKVRGYVLDTMLDSGAGHRGINRLRGEA